MEENNRNKSLLLFLAVSIAMLTLSWMLRDVLAYNKQAAYVEEVTEETETVTVETEEIEQEEVELNKVYDDLELEVDNKLSISDDGEYFSYRCYYNDGLLNFVSKVDNSLNYEILNIYKDGSYTYVIFKYNVNKELH